MTEKDMKKLLTVLLIVMVSIVSIGHYIKIEKYREEERIKQRIVELGLDIPTLMKGIQEKRNEEKRYQQISDEYGEKLKAGWNTPEWQEIKKLRDIRDTYGLKSTDNIKLTFELSFYTDLNCENGYGNLTASGKILADGMIANNFLPFGTKIYIEGYGMKTVEDRGSKKYFNSVNKIDVLVPRLSGENDYEYYKRVNAMGRKHVVGYIFK